MGKATNNVSLRLWTPQGASVAYVKQVAPAIEDLTDRAAPLDALTADYPTGAWGDESRDYHVCIHVQPRDVGEEMLAGRFSLLVGDEVLSQALVQGDLDRRRAAVNADQPGGRSLHRPGRARRRHPGGPRGAKVRRRAARRRSSSGAPWRSPPQPGTTRR